MRIRAWLGRCRDGRYMLSKKRPVEVQIGPGGPRELYVPYGDPIGYKYMCPEITKLLFGVELDLLTCQRVWVEAGTHGDVLSGVNVEAAGKECEQELAAVSGTWFPTQPI